MRRLFQLEITRFVAIGVINTAFSYSVYALLLMLGMSFVLANLFALILGILFSFKTQGAYVFKNRANHLLGRFVLAWSLIYVISISLIGSLVYLGFNPYLAGALALPASTAASYLLQKFFVFRSASNSAFLKNTT